jgi:hypothetical protein
MYLGICHAAYEAQNSVLTGIDPGPDYCDYSQINRNEAQRKKYNCTVGLLQIFETLAQNLLTLLVCLVFYFKIKSTAL